MRAKVALHFIAFIFVDFTDGYEYHPHWIMDIPEEREELYIGDMENYGRPQFLHESTFANVSVKKGSDAFLHCKVSGIGEQSVSWYKRNKDQIQLLTFGFQTYHNDGRFSLNFVQPYDWRLRIRGVRNTDAGTYECQVSTHPPVIRIVNLTVVVPSMRLLDDRGMPLREKFYKTGSSIVLKCEAENVPTRHLNVHLHWFHGQKRLSYNDPRGGISVKTEIRGLSAKSWLRIANAQPRDSGTYFCSVSGLKPRGGQIHVVQDEFPAAIQASPRFTSPAILPSATAVIVVFYTIFMGKLPKR